MSDERSEAEKLALRFFREQARILNSLPRRGADSGFQAAVRSMLGSNPKQGKRIRIGGCELNYSSHTSSLVSFLPTRWQSEFDKSQGGWRGCEKWWAGYPLIVWIEMRNSDDGKAGHLWLNAEVGPVSPVEARRAIIDEINGAASATKLERIQFPADALHERQLYSRFLRRNSIGVAHIQNADEVESKFAALISGFEPEFEMIVNVIPRLLTHKVR